MLLFIFARLFVLALLSRFYKFDKSQKFIFILYSWKDNTVMGVWERAKASTIISPFTKISFTKMLVLSDTKAREDYFSQQANFVSTEGHWDDHAEFSTTINGR